VAVENCTTRLPLQLACDFTLEIIAENSMFVR
jgi:hypothetical protein